MPTEVYREGREGREREAARDVPRPVRPRTREALLAAFGDEYLSINALFRFCFVPSGRIALLRELAPDEEWGSSHFVLLKYLAVHLRLAIEQGRLVWNGDQMVLAAGKLCSRAGAPLYVGLVPNQDPDDNPWVLNWVGERPSTGEPPEPADLGTWPALDAGAEVLVACELESPERRLAPPPIAGLPRVVQVSALVGAVHWALKRGLALRQIHSGGRGYFVPVYLSGREDLEAEPDAVAPLTVQSERLLVRTLLEPHVAYSPARVCVERAELLPGWLLESWDRVGAREPQAGASGIAGAVGSASTTPGQLAGPGAEVH
jgi:hypothetical protein